MQSNFELYHKLIAKRIKNYFRLYNFKVVGMRLRIVLNSSNSIKLPKAYNHLLQGFIYKLIDNDLSKFLHTQGYRYGKRSFKLFCFSRLFGKFKIFDDAFR
jgi:CRISPR-associated endoribonuclease Cas6